MSAAPHLRNPRLPRLWADTRGATTIEKIIVIAVFVFAVVSGIVFLSGAANTSFLCQARSIVDGTFACGGATQIAANPNRPVGSQNPLACTGTACMCFVAGTPVVTENGLQAIETIEPGTLVLARPESGEGPPAFKPVEKLFVSRARSLVHLTVTNGAGTSETFGVTGNHPVFVESRGWANANTLVPGVDLLVDRDGRPLRVDAVESIDEQVTVYNFTVAEFHTYFVGTTGVWVHNEPLRPIGSVVRFDVVDPNTGAVLFSDRGRVLRNQANGTTLVQGFNNDGTPYQGRLDEQGRVIRFNPVGTQRPFIVNDNGVRRPTRLQISGINDDGTYDVQGHLNGRPIQGRANNDGTVTIYPEIGSRITVTVGRVNSPALVVGRNPDGSSEIEGTLNGRRWSGSIPLGSATATRYSNPARTPYQAGQPIMGLTPTVVQIDGHDVTRIGAIHIIHPPAEPGGPSHYASAESSFVPDVLDDLNTIVQTESGRQLWTDLQANGIQGRRTYLGFVGGYNYWDGDEVRALQVGADAVDGVPSDTLIGYNPSLVGIPLRFGSDTGVAAADADDLRYMQAGFGRAFNNPPDVQLVHELVHAVQFGRGISSDNSFDGSHPVDEEHAVGLGDFNNPAIPSENQYRRERDLALRGFYGDVNETLSTEAGRGGVSALDHVAGPGGASMRSRNPFVALAVDQAMAGGPAPGTSPFAAAAAADSAPGSPTSSKAAAYRPPPASRPASGSGTSGAGQGAGTGGGPLILEPNEIPTTAGGCG